MFKNIKAEQAAKALANTKEDFKNAMGAYQAMIQTLTFAYSSDKEAIYEVTGISAKAVAPPPRGNVQSVPRRPMVNGKVIGKPCPTCGKTIKQVSKSNLKPAPRVQKVEKEIDDLLAGLDLEKQEERLNQNRQEYNDLQSNEKAKEAAEVAEKQKVIDELANMKDEDLSKEAEEKPKNRGGRPPKAKE